MKKSPKEVVLPAVVEEVHQEVVVVGHLEAGDSQEAPQGVGVAGVVLFVVDLPGAEGSGVVVVVVVEVVEEALGVGAVGEDIDFHSCNYMTNPKTPLAPSG